jgi:hypothetical protein
MNRLTIHLSLGLLTLLFSNCNPKKNFNFYGKWQSLNDSGFLVEIDSTNIYHLYRDGKVMFEEEESFKNPKIQIHSQHENWYEFRIGFNKNAEEMVKGRIEVVNPERIRIYYYKHHNILDLADEFHRTKDLKSFDSIMSKIMAEQ